MPSHAVKSFIRNGDFFKITQFMETGAEQGMWTWPRYQGWLEKKRDWHIPDDSEQAESDPGESSVSLSSLPPLSAASRPQISSAPRPAKPSSSSSGAASRPGGPIEIEPVEGGLSEVIRRMEGE